MQRIILAFLISIITGAFSFASAHSLHKNLKDYASKPRVYKPIGCKYTDVPGHEHFGKKIIQNYDMEPSIARSDTFDIVHYNVDLDVTQYTNQYMKAHCGIAVSYTHLTLPTR